MTKSKALRIAGIIAAVLIVLVAGAVIAVRIAFPPEKVQAMIVPRAEQYLGREVRLEKAGVSIFPFVGLRVRGLSVGETDRPGFADSAFLKISDFQVRIAVMPLLRRQIEIERIVLGDMYARAEMDSSGSYNYSDLAFVKSDSTAAKKEQQPESGMPLPPIPLTLQKFVITNGSVEYINHQNDQTIVLGDINQRATFDIDQELRDVRTAGTLRIAEISVAARELSRPIENLAITIEHEAAADVVEQKASLKRLRASVQDVYINCDGTIDNFLTVPRVDLNITTDTLRIKQLLDAVPASLVPSLEGAEGSGTLFLNAALEGEVDSEKNPRVDGALHLANVSVDYPDLPESISGGTADIFFTEDSVRVERFDVKIGENPVKVKALVADFAQPWIDATIDATIDLETVGKMVTMPECAAVSGTAAASLRANGRADPADPSKLDLDGTVSLSSVTAITPAVTKPVVTNGSVAISAAAVRPDLAVEIGSSSLTLKGALHNYLPLVLPDTAKKYPRPRFTFTLDAPLLNTDEFLPKSTAGDAAAGADTVTPGLLLPAPLPGIDMKGEIRTGRLLYQGIELKNINARLTSVNDVMDFVVDATMYGGALSHTLHVDARDMRDLKVRSDMDVNGVQMNAFVSGVNDLLPADNALYAHLRAFDDGVYGNARMNSRFNTRGGTADQMIEALEGNLYAKLTDGKITGGPILESISGSMDKMLELAGIGAIDEIEFRDMRIRARVQNERVLLDTITIASPNTGDWSAGGAVGFNASLDVDIANRLPKDVSDKMNGLAGGVQQTAKDLIGQLGLGGAAKQYLSDQANKLAFPTDKAGRITVLLALGGTVSNPVPTDFRVAEVAGAASTAPGKSPSQRAREQLSEKKEQLEKQAAEKLEQEKERAAAEARKRKEQARKELEEQKEKTEKAIEEKADDVKKKLKGLF